MADNSILGCFSFNISLLIVCLTVFDCCSYKANGSGLNSFTVSSFCYHKTELKPYDWHYIKVDLPPWFASMTMALDSDIDLDISSIRKAPKSTPPMICVRHGSPPLPDVYNSSLTGLVLDPLSNATFGEGGLQFTEKCYPMQKNVLLVLTNEQMAPGVWYFGLFNGIGSMRTQSKMINRGSTYSFSGNVSVEGCITPGNTGSFCNQTINLLSCVDSFDLTTNQTAKYITYCRNENDESCSSYDEPKIYSLDIMGLSEAINISVKIVSYNESKPSNGSSSDGSKIILIGYARLGLMPSSSLYDYVGNISDAPLVIRSPKVGRWYVTIVPLNLSEKNSGGLQDASLTVCYSLEWQVLQCPSYKAGLNCTWEKYLLQTVPRANSQPFESYYLPVSPKVSSNSANFLVEPLLSNSSNGKNLGSVWTYFILDIPFDATGGNIHINIASNTKLNYGIYMTYGGLPSDSSWDYFYENSTTNSNGSMFFKLYDADEKAISFYILYARGGTWGLGLKQSSSTGTAAENQTSLSISFERCPRRCSYHGTCQFSLDVSGLSSYSYCSCDRNHGGFDCSVEIVSHRGHIWQSIALIGSNAAAVLPAYWALRQKSFAEWVLFTSSGISSALYHACDVGTWCALSFKTLQFMDFWLSFMAVVSTFVYLTGIDEVSKRGIHTVVAILTALMAESGATRSSNIALVIAIGALGLLVGWLIEFFTNHRPATFSTELILNVLHSLRHGLVGDFCKILQMANNKKMAS